MIAAPVKVVVQPVVTSGRREYIASGRVDGRVLSSVRFHPTADAAWTRAFLDALLFAPNVRGVQS